MEARKRHSILWKSLRPAVLGTAKLIFNYEADVCREPGPLLIMSNHNADLDPLLIAYSFPEVVYFVASEHIMRSKVAWFLRWATELIPRQKGGNASSTVRGIVRHLNSGHNVCIFPEGNRSWDGVTRPITPATGKMARMCGAKLVTYRTDGIYFSNPRWAGGSLRRGKTHGKVVGIYEPDYLMSITPKAVQELIERDLYENSYDRQRKKPVKFTGRHLAEHLETLLFMCPHCHAEGKMRSEGNYLICDDCGTCLRYTPEGFFVGENMIFDTVLDWNIWQSSVIEKKCLEAGEDEIIFSDDMMELYSVSTGTSKELLACGSLKLYRDRLVLPNGTEISTGKISGMSILGPQDLYFSSGGKNYTVKCGSAIRCVCKYLTACSVFDKNLKFGV